MDHLIGNTTYHGSLLINLFLLLCMKCPVSWSRNKTITYAYHDKPSHGFDSAKVILFFHMLKFFEKKARLITSLHGRLATDGPLTNSSVRRHSDTRHQYKLALILIRHKSHLHSPLGLSLFGTLHTAGSDEYIAYRRTGSPG